MSKLWRVIGDNVTEQVLLETSAENVTVTDTGEKLEATTVEGALSELADGVNEARRANIIDVGQGIPTTENGDTITPVNFKFSDGTNKTVNIYAKQGATGAKIVSTYLIGHTDGGDNIYQQTFDNGSTAKFIAPKGDSGVDDYEELKSKPIIYAILNSISNPVENTYYKHVGATTERFINGYIYLYTGGEYKAIDGSGSGGAGSANYTKIESTIPTSAWVLSAPSWIGQNALTWSTRGNTYYTQGGTEDLGLVIGSTYTATLTIDGTDYSADDSRVMEADGMNAYVARFNSSVILQILDHCAGFDTAGNFTVGNGYCVMVMLIGETVPSSVIVKSFSGAEKISAAIENSAIKVNSAVKMFIDYSGKIKAVGKANGSLTVSANAIPTVDIPYAIEISDTNKEGLFEVINSYVPEMPKIPTQQQADWEQTDDTAVDYIKNKPAIPEIPTIPTDLPQTAEGSTEQTWAKGETTIEVSNSSITLTSDIDIILSYEGQITGTFTTGKFTLQANPALTKNVTFKYKIKQTSGYGQINIINNYRIPKRTYSSNYLRANTLVQTSVWVSSSAYSQYPHQAEISITDLDWLKKRLPVKPVESIDKITADVVFDVAEALSGIFAPVCSVVKPESDNEDVKVIIYSSEVPSASITIPTIKLTYEGTCGV